MVAVLPAVAPFSVRYTKHTVSLLLKGKDPATLPPLVAHAAFLDQRKSLPRSTAKLLEFLWRVASRAELHAAAAILTVAVSLRAGLRLNDLLRFQASSSLFFRSAVTSSDHQASRDGTGLNSKSHHGQPTRARWHLCRQGASAGCCRHMSIKRAHVSYSWTGEAATFLVCDRSRVVAHCEKAAAVASLQAQTDGLSDHLESVASKMKKSPGQFSATASQDLEDIEEINQENYHQKIEEADAPVVLVDFYTSWCGPCKLMYPQLVAMKGELEGQVTFYKFNCNKANKELGTKLDIKVAPTFILYKGGEEATRLTGAKVDPLRAAIDDLIE